MRQVTYAQRFEGDARRVGPDGAALVVAATALECQAISHIGGGAMLESDVTFTGATTFQEEGVIIFGAGAHRLRFSTIGSGYLDPTMVDDRRYGAVIRRIDGGDGAFAGAGGLIASILCLTSAGELTDDHLAVILIR